MEIFGIFGLLGFVLAGHLQIEIKKLKIEISKINSTLAAIKSDKGE